VKYHKSFIVMLYFYCLSLPDDIQTNNYNQNKAILKNYPLHDPENVLMNDDEFLRLSFEQEKDQIYLDEATTEELESLYTVNPKNIIF